jgi:hypothetical protein
MHQEVKSINAPLHRDPGPSSSQSPSAVPPSDHQKPARVPHAPTGALFFRSIFFVFTVFLEESSSSSIQTLSSRARAAKSGSTRARAWPNNKRAEPEQPRLELGLARLQPYPSPTVPCRSFKAASKFIFSIVSGGGVHLISSS